MKIHWQTFSTGLENCANAFSFSVSLDEIGATAFYLIFGIMQHKLGPKKVDQLKLYLLSITLFNFKNEGFDVWLPSFLRWLASHGVCFVSVLSLLR